VKAGMAGGVRADSPAPGTDSCSFYLVCNHHNLSTVNQTWCFECKLICEIRYWTLP
jgi:hypothetical protein